MRFTTRDLLWLTLVVGLLIRWGIDSHETEQIEMWKARAEILRDELRSFGWKVQWVPPRGVGLAAPANAPPIVPFQP